MATDRRSIYETLLLFFDLLRIKVTACSVGWWLMAGAGLF
jgi:hypothetical protein